MKAIIMFPVRLFGLLFGRFSWSAPPWLKTLYTIVKRGFAQNTGVSIASVAIIVALIAIYAYYRAQPTPRSFVAVITVPDIPSNNEASTPSPLNILFNYDKKGFEKNQIRPDTAPSVARIDLIGEKIIKGIDINPSIEGKWHWVDGHKIEFKPSQNWPPFTEYEVRFDKSLFAEKTRLSQDNISFTTHPFNVSIDNLEFYQDPIESSVRRVISTLSFSHPVDAKSLEKSLALTMRLSGSSIKTPGTKHNFSVSYDKNYREAYIQSDALQLPGKENYMTLTASPDIYSLLGGAPNDNAVSSKVLIPDVFSFLQVRGANIQIINNRENDPEQVITLEFTDEIYEEVLKKNLELYLLPTNFGNSNNKRWSSPGKVTSAAIQKSLRLDIQQIPNPRLSSKTFSFVLDVPESREVYLKINKGLTSVNKFIYNTSYDRVFGAPRYPREISIAGEGSILTDSGEHKLTIHSRGVSTIKTTVGRLLEGQIYHLVSQTNGDITQANFNNWSYSAENLAEFEEKSAELRNQNPKEENYSSIDLSEYLPTQKNQFGVFFVDIKAYNKGATRPIYGVEDQRLVLVTDLGIIVKNNADRSHDVFVQSIDTGRPVAGANVQLLGKNGVALMSQNTSNDGHVSFPPTSGFSREKQPVVYVVKTEDDISFIPYDRGSRQLNLSKFNVGGVAQHRQASSNKNAQLNAFGFSDRGIYRPGEKVNMGFIVKQMDLNNIEGIPLEISVQGPRFNQLDSQIIQLPEMGLLDFSFDTELTSDTGQYNVSLYLVRSNNRRGRLIGSSSFNVEEFQPDTMKIKSELLGLGTQAWSTAKSITADINLNNLFGLPAQDRRVEGRLIVKPTQFLFGEFKDYAFTASLLDTDSAPLSINQRLDPQTTDADGKAQFHLALDQFRNGTYSVQFTAEGYDQAGGRSVISRNNTLISPLEHLIGYKADGKLDYINQNSERTLSFVVVNTELENVEKIDLILKKLEVQEVSTLIKQRNGTYQYQSMKKETHIEEKTFSIARGGKQLKLNTAEAGDFALEIYDSNNRRLARVDYSVVGFGNTSGNIDKNAALQLKLNNQDYSPGDSIEMNIKAPYVGAGLITIETDKVEAYRWFKSDKKSSVQNITLPKGIEGNAYVNVSFLRDPGSKEIFTSPLSYAVAPFSINKDKRKLTIELDIPEIARPGKTMTIDYSASDKSKIVVFAVDEGILQVANYKTPEPLSYFLQKKALGVRTLQILDLILPEFNLSQDLSASGGGTRSMRKALAKNLNPFSRKTDAPAIYWSGVIDATPEQKQLHFTIPETFSGSLRVMAVAVSKDAFGSTSQSNIVRGPFVLAPNILTQTAPGDNFFATLGVTNIIEGSGKSAEISIKVVASEHLNILDNPERTVNIDENGEKSITFHVEATDKLGAGELTFFASHRGVDGKRRVSLSVRPAVPYISEFISGYSKRGDASIDLPRRLYPDLAEQSVAASSSPLVLIDGLHEYLKHFPHGCTEQVVSKVFPMIGLMSHPIFTQADNKLREYFDHVVLKLRERQQGSGGFSFWPGNASVAEYPSIYAAHFLIEAQAQGLQVPNDMMNRVKEYLRDYVGRQSPNLHEARIRANAIYLLTRMGVVSTNYLVELHEYLEKNHQKQWRSDLAGSYIAATYKLLKKESDAEDLISYYQIGKAKNQTYGDFHSPLAQDAQHLYLLSKHFVSRTKKIDGQLMLRFTDPIFKGEYNTISAAYSILALGAYSQVVSNAVAEQAINFAFKNTENKDIELVGSPFPFPKATYPTDATAVNISSEKPVFFLNIQNGFDKGRSKEPIKQGLEIHRDFIDDQGNKVSEFRQGEELTVRLRIRALDKRVLTNIAVVDLLPGGFEVIRSSVARTAYNWRADYVDVREDRIVYYGTFNNQIKDLTYKVKLSSAGNFAVPPSFAQSMYDRSIKAMSKSSKFVVKPYSD